eukprot:scaffold74427_cov27-Tisochrysis_lutea.AAC.2
MRRNGTKATVRRARATRREASASTQTSRLRRATRRLYPRDASNSTNQGERLGFITGRIVSSSIDVRTRVKTLAISAVMPSLYPSAAGRMPAMNTLSTLEERERRGGRTDTVGDRLIRKKDSLRQPFRLLLFEMLELDAVASVPPPSIRPSNECLYGDDLGHRGLEPTYERVKEAVMKQSVLSRDPHSGGAQSQKVLPGPFGAQIAGDVRCSATTKVAKAHRRGAPVSMKATDRDERRHLQHSCASENAAASVDSPELLAVRDEHGLHPLKHPLLLPLQIARAACPTVRCDKAAATHGPEQCWKEVCHLGSRLQRGTGRRNASE